MINFKIKIAGIIIGFESEGRDLEYSLSKNSHFKGFQYCGRKKPHVCFMIKSGNLPNHKGKKVLFNAQDRLKICAFKDKFFYEYLSGKDGNINRLIEISKDMSDNIIYFNRHRVVREVFKESEKAGRSIMSTIKENFLHSFFITYLAKYKRGLLAHSACIKDNDKVYLFMGRTQAGKSTLAKIWHEEANAQVFNDDRAILRLEDKGVYFYNTPWRGIYTQGYQPTSKDRLKINKIFFIYQEKKNILNTISGKDASLKLFKNAFLSPWDGKVMADSLTLCAEITRIVPCYKLGFVNDERIVEFVRRYAGN